MSEQSMTSGAMLQTWFKNSIQPSKTLLWVSAVAPDSFQGNPQILEELLKRPLEIPDAMGQQRASARYSACLIARAISEMNPSPTQIISLLHEFHFFQNPDILLRKPLPESLITQIKKLIREAFDPTTFWQYELRTLTQHFKEGLHVLGTLFKSRHKKKPTPNVTSFFVSEHDWWGSNYHPEVNVVNIHPPFLFLPVVSKSLVLRDAVRVFLPSSFQSAWDVQEFANILVTELLDISERHLWPQIKWNGTQPTSEQLEWISTISAIAPTLLEKNHLPSLFKRLNRINSIVSGVPTGAFTIITQQEITDKKYPHSITKPQRKILLTLAKNPLVSERQIAKTTQLARGTINRNFMTLQEQFGIRTPGEINFQKIGLTPLFLIVQSNTTEKTGALQLFALSQQLRSFPYCFRLNSPLTPTNSTLYAILALPKEIISDFQNHLKQWMDKVNLKTELFKIHQFTWGWDFTYWEEFCPDEWKILASSSIRPERSEFNVTTSVIYEKPAIKLTREALRVLHILQKDMRISQRQLAKSAQTSVTTAANHHGRLIPDVITPYVEFTNPPHPEGIITLVDCPSKENFDHFLAGIHLLPAFQTWHLTKIPSEEPPSLVFTANFPQGGLVPFLDVFQEVTGFHESIGSIPLITSKQLPRIHHLPLALFKTVGQEWMCSSALLESLFNLASQ